VGAAPGRSVVAPGSLGRRWSGLLACLVHAHAPSELRLAGFVPVTAAADWDWVKWLPHTRPTDTGGGFARAACSVVTEPAALSAVLAGLGAAETTTLLLLDGWAPGGPLAGVPGLAGVLDGPGARLRVLVLCEAERDVPASASAVLRVGRGADGTVSAWLTTGGAAPTVLRLVPELPAPAELVDLGRRLAPLRDAGGFVTAGGGTVRLLDLLGEDTAAGLTPEAGWLRPADLAEGDAGHAVALVNADQDGTARPRAAATSMDSTRPMVELDLKEAAAGGQGPHGMLVGATGSGKSELLRTLLASLAAAHDPELFAFIGVDFKGGAAFAELAGLPHCAGLVTNLAEDLALVERVRLAVEGELARRQQALRDAGGVDTLAEYQGLRAGGHRDADGVPLPALPWLLLVVDEAAELLAARPEFLETFVTVGRLGRSLGVHLLFATQRLDEGRIRGLEGYLRYRLCCAPSPRRSPGRCSARRRRRRCPPSRAWAICVSTGIRCGCAPRCPRHRSGPPRRRGWRRTCDRSRCSRRRTSRGPVWWPAVEATSRRWSSGSRACPASRWRTRCRWRRCPSPCPPASLRRCRRAVGWPPGSGSWTAPSSSARTCSRWT